MSVLDPIIAQVEALTAVDASVLALIDSLVAAVKAAPTLADAQAVADQISAEKDKLAAAVTANT